jgi:hypothetical protein
MALCFEKPFPQDSEINMTQSYHSPDSQRQSDSQRQFDSQRQLDARDRDDDTMLEDPSLSRERAEERERAEARDRAREQAQLATPARSDETKAATFGTSYLGDRNTDEPWEQWRQIQADFVDNPRSAVSNAHGLVGGLIQDIVRKFEEERNQLEQRWSSGEDVSTEDLRTCLQTYRDFFGRLLATNEPKH